MTETPHRGALVLASGIALLMHLLFFALAKPSFGPESVHAVPPVTRYMSGPSADGLHAGLAVRTLWSPVLFSLPASVGFSGELDRLDVATRLAFKQQSKPEFFLPPGAAAPSMNAVGLEGLMLTAGRREAPMVPEELLEQPVRRPAARRVAIPPELMERLVGGVVLPPELNKATELPWEVRATINVSERGVVRQVLLDKPMDFPVLNQSVIQLLYGLRFKPGPVLDGTIELYSPEPGLAGAVAP